MKYIIPQTYYLYNLLSGGDTVASVIEQQVFLAEHGIDWQSSDKFIDIEREIAVNILIKQEKEKAKNRSLEWSIFCRLFQ